MKIERVLERISYWQANNNGKKTGEISFGNLAEFCRTIMVNEQEVRAAIQKARIANKNSCKVGEWIFHWFYIDDIRNALTSKKIKISVRTQKFRVETALDPKLGDEHDKTFDKMLRLFGER